jgi:trehalose-6-phosphate synthase
MKSAAGSRVALATDRLLETHPEYIGKVRFVQIASPSRTRLEQYQAISREIEALVEEINWKHSRPRWTPIVYRKEHHTPRRSAGALLPRRRVRRQRPARRHELRGQGIRRCARADGDGV